MEKWYSIPLVWQMGGRVKVKADSLAEAKEFALGPAPLPEGYYITDSAEIDEESGIQITDTEPA